MVQNQYGIKSRLIQIFGLLWDQSLVHQKTMVDLTFITYADLQISLSIDR